MTYFLVFYNNNYNNCAYNYRSEQCIFYALFSQCIFSKYIPRYSDRDLQCLQTTREQHT